MVTILRAVWGGSFISVEHILKIKFNIQMNYEHVLPIKDYQIMCI